MSLDSEQDDNIERVTKRIGAAILDFFKPPRDEYHADDLRRFVLMETGIIAPASADRIMRQLRQKKLIDYEVVNRRASLYRIIRNPRQGDLFA